MKNLFLLILTFLIVVCFSNNTFAQDGDLKDHGKYTEIGINATSFVKEFLSLNTSDVEIGRYMLTYKRHANQRAFRLGIGGSFNQTTEKLEGGGNRTNKDNAADIRIGYEWTKKLSKRWNTYVGIDGLFGFEQNKTTTDVFEITKLTTTSSTFGGGPILGIQFFFNSNISLSTESTLYYKHSELSEEQEFSQNIGGPNNKETSTQDRFDFGLPTSLFFIIRF